MNLEWKDIAPPLRTLDSALDQAITEALRPSRSLNTSTNVRLELRTATKPALNGHNPYSLL